MDEDTHQQSQNDAATDTDAADDNALSQATSSNAADPSNPAMILLNMENLIKNHHLHIEQLQTELKKHQDMLNDIFTNESGFQEASKQAKEANKLKASARKQVTDRTEVKALVQKLKDMKSELGELRNALSDYLGEYARMSGVSEIEGYDGEMRQIVYNAKLVKKGK